jgi:hypothetical protein
MKRVCWPMKGCLAGREQQHQNSQQWKALTILIATKTNQQEPGTKSTTKEGLKTATKGAANCCKEADCCKGGRTVARELLTARLARRSTHYHEDYLCRRHQGSTGCF